jgi:hypothetical protein
LASSHWVCSALGHRLVAAKQCVRSDDKLNGETPALPAFLFVLRLSSGLF